MVNFFTLHWWDNQSLRVNMYRHFTKGNRVWSCEGSFQ